MTGFGSCWPEVVKKSRAASPQRKPVALVSLCHPLGELPQHLCHLAPQLFIVPLQYLVKLGYTNIIEIGGINSWPGETVNGDQ